MANWYESLWFSFLVSTALKSTVVLGVAWIVAAMLGRRSAAARHTVWTAAAVAVLALPLLNAVLPDLRFPGANVLDSGTWLVSTTTSAATPDRASTLPQVAATSGQVTRAGSSFDWRLCLMLMWAAGSALSLCKLAVASVEMARARRRSRAFGNRELVFELCHTLDMEAVPVYQDPGTSMPVAFGMFKPSVYLPESASEWPEERQRLVLLHELAHIRRGDPATHWLGRTMVILYWWNPLAWMAWKAFLKERERAADDLVLQTGARASAYAGELLEVARGLQQRSLFTAEGVAMARRSELEGRLVAILDPAVPRGGPRPMATAAAAVLAVVLIAPFAAVRAQSQSDVVLPPDVDATIRAASAQKNHEILDQAAKAAAAQGKLEMAHKLLDASAAIREQVSGTRSVEYGVGLIKLGQLAQRQGHTDEALGDYTRAIQAIGDRPEAVPALVESGVMLLAKRDEEGAFGNFQRAERADPAHAEVALTWMAVIRARRSETMGEADVLFQRAMPLYQGDTLEKAATMDLYAGLLHRSDRNSEADVLRKQANDIRRGLTTRISLPTDTSRVGNGVTSPVPIYKPEPEYSEEARLAKFQGEVMVSVIILPDGTASNIQVVKGMGLGLDEKAIDAVKQWRFKPGTKNGVPVAVQAQISVNFRLL